MRDIGEKVRKYMKKKKTIVKFGPDGYEDEFDGLTEDSELVVIPNFLPSPAELAGKAKKTRITLELNDEDIEFFKKQAKKLGASYQQMIRNLVSRYVREFKPELN